MSTRQERRAHQRLWVERAARAVSAKRREDDIQHFETSAQERTGAESLALQIRDVLRERLPGQELVFAPRAIASALSNLQKYALLWADYGTDPEPEPELESTLAVQTQSLTFLLFDCMGEYLEELREVAQCSDANLRADAEHKITDLAALYELLRQMQRSIFPAPERGKDSRAAWRPLARLIEREILRGYSAGSKPPSLRATARAVSGIMELVGINIDEERVRKALRGGLRPAPPRQPVAGT